MGQFHKAIASQKQVDVVLGELGNAGMKEGYDAAPAFMFVARKSELHTLSGTISSTTL